MAPRELKIDVKIDAAEAARLLQNGRSPVAAAMAELQRQQDKLDAADALAAAIFSRPQRRKAPKPRRPQKSEPEEERPPKPRRMVLL